MPGGASAHGETCDSCPAIPQRMSQFGGYRPYTPSAFGEWDQFWFTEKNPKTGATALYSMAEYSVRKGQDIEKGYLLGKFGAVPFIPTGRIIK